MYIAGAVPRALTQKEAIETALTAPSFVGNARHENAAEAPKAARTPPALMAFDFVNFAANGQTITIPNAVGTAPIVLINEDIETPFVYACE